LEVNIVLETLHRLFIVLTVESIPVGINVIKKMLFLVFNFLCWP